MTDATEDLARLSYRIEELESLLVMERQTTIGQAAEIQRIRALAKAAETRFSVDRQDHDLALRDALRETAELADLCAFWRYQAVWQRAVRLQRDLMSTPLENIEDTPQWKEAERQLEEARRAENRERHSHAEAPRDPGGT